MVKKALRLSPPPYRRPYDVRLEPSAEPGTLVISFPIPRADFAGVLSSTEADIVQGILAGLSNAAIARRRGTAVRTIANQVASIYRKLEVRSRLELGLLALTGRHAPRRE